VVCSEDVEEHGRIKEEEPLAGFTAKRVDGVAEDASAGWAIFDGDGDCVACALVEVAIERGAAVADSRPSDEGLPSKLGGGPHF
jgi:hypothetical protein